MIAAPEIEEMRARLNAHSVERIEVGKRVVELEGKIDALTDALAGVDKRLGKIEERSAERNDRLTRIESAVASIVSGASEDRAWLRGWIERREAADAAAAADWRGLTVKVLGALGLAIAGAVAGWLGSGAGSP